MTPAQLAALKTEILTGPFATEFVGKSDNYIADTLNDPARGGGTVARTIIPSYEIINATVPAEWAALSADAKQRYQTLTGAGSVDASNANVQAAFLAMFAAGATTRTNLVAMVRRPGSRAELLGSVQPVTYNDVNEARAL
jgi:hypothetical protein